MTNSACGQQKAEVIGGEAKKALDVGIACLIGAHTGTTGAEVFADAARKAGLVF
jgi:hypothetical protein